jgi:hypothetical protein
VTVTSFVPVSAFYCFDPADHAFCESLDRHLAPLKYSGRIQTWDEQHILAGSEWERERNQYFSTARLLIFLLSPDFLASARGQQDIQMALDRQQAAEAVVIPLLLRPCSWEETELRSLQMLPRDHHPLTLQAHPDKVWQEMVLEISRILDALYQCIYLISTPEDQEIVERLSQDITRSGVAIWHLKGTQLSPDLAEEREAMRQASSVLLVASPAAFSSRVVRTQKELAEVYKRPIQVVWVSGEEHEWSVAGTWQKEAMLDARTERYETAKENLLARLTQPLKVVSSLEEPLQPVTAPRNPYKGLQSFTARDTGDFFGREALIDELLMTVEHLLAPGKKGQPDHRLLAVLGASGSGKSSVVLAGLLPSLQHGGVFNSQDWLYLDPMVPGTHPLEALALSLAQQSSLGNVASLHRELTADSLRTLHLLACQLVNASSRNLVLFIDQFEEVFTLTASEEERQHFFDLLITAVTEPQGPLLVILTLRADFSDRVMQYPALYRLLDAHRVSVLPMERDELRQVIEEPARLPDVQIIFEGDLVGDLLFDMREQVGALPLLSFTLDQLFAHRDGQMLTLSAYRDIGGVKGALARHAQATYDALPTKEHRAYARSLFLRLIDPGHSEQDTTRRRARLTELELPDPAQTRLLQETVNAFLAARLLTTNKHAGVATIEVSHEALIREWPRLAEWLREAREDIHVQQKISEDAGQWQQRHRPHDRLYRGSQLKEARAWARRNAPSQQEETFLRASAKQRLSTLIGMISLVLVLFSTTGIAVWFVTQRSPDPTQVTTLENDGVGSLRWAIDNAPSGQTITFAPGLAGQIITLTSTLSIPNKHLSIIGPVARRITLRNPTHGIAVDDHASLTITNVAFTGGQKNGGSLFTNKGNLTLTNSTISSNTAFSGIGGGGIFNEGGSLTLTNSTVSGNTASGGGGGIFNEGGTVTLAFCTLYGNTANNGGGLSAKYYDLPIVPSRITMSNSLVAGNQAFTGPDMAGKLTTEGYNLIQSTSGTTFFDPDHKHGTDQTSIPLLEIKIDPHLQLNGSTTTETHALLPGSPALDAIPLAACLVYGVPLTTDQRGVKRPQGSACDIGAYE